ncbi:MAG: hypothetical protein FWC10_10845 [Lentimicrobiaceae bacterium]|nr:hypothetical protein [Lentimicrobiaceae bacterium]
MFKVRLNLRKVVKIGVACLAVTVVFLGCKKDDNEQTKERDPLTYDEGVVINGVKWATRNVDKPGTFAIKPESSGMLYKWNSKVAWLVIGEFVDNWDNSLPDGTEWIKENDPSPVGWRIPTKEELQKLLDAGYILTEINGVKGLSFGTTPNTIFLPIRGALNSPEGKIKSDVAAYWSKDLIEGKMNYLLYNNDVKLFEYPLSLLVINIRCVAI